MKKLMLIIALVSFSFEVEAKNEKVESNRVWLLSGGLAIIGGASAYLVQWEQDAERFYRGDQPFGEKWGRRSFFLGASLIAVPNLYEGITGRATPPILLRAIRVGTPVLCMGGILLVPLKKEF